VSDMQRISVRTDQSEHVLAKENAIMP